MLVILFRLIGPDGAIYSRALSCRLSLGRLVGLAIMFASWGLVSINSGLDHGLGLLQSVF